MYTEQLPEVRYTTTLVKVKYDCCGKDHVLKWKDADKNFQKNGGKHICRPCWLKMANPSKDAKVRDKIKETNLQRYGTECSMNREDLVEARVEKMFGTKEATEKIVQKRRQTSVNRYGVDHPMKTEEVKEKQHEVMREKYGVDVPLQNPEILAKMRQTMQNRYGVENCMQIPEVVQKQQDTTEERFCMVCHYNELPEMREYLTKHCREWLKDSWENPWAAGITRPEEWNEKQSKTMADKIIAGEYEPNDPRFYLTGYFVSDKCKKKKAFFRSSLELLTHYLLHTDNDVEWYENEPFAIEYQNELGQTRRYIPDFIAYRKTKKPWLLEIKPAFRMREEVTQCKVQSAKQFALDNGWEFSYISEKDLDRKSLNEIKNLPFVEVITNKT